MDKPISKSIIVGVDFSAEDRGVMIIGEKKPNQAVEIINAFQGKEAYDLYLKLTTKKGGVE